uniref:Snake toxin/toxin-like domain-containing protein n=2 Tax=Amphiprion TaxID=80969 RepID=A0AAQ5YNS0_AMPOC
FSSAFVNILRSSLPAVYGLKCYTCWGRNPGHCNDIWECPPHFDRCSSTIVSENLINKQCMKSDMCGMDSMFGMRCCSGDLCNGAKHNGVFLPILLAPLVIITLYI